MKDRQVFKLLQHGNKEAEADEHNKQNSQYTMLFSQWTFVRFVIDL
jgi:hypothetical protein